RHLDIDTAARGHDTESQVAAESGLQQITFVRRVEPLTRDHLQIPGVVALMRVGLINPGLNGDLGAGDIEWPGRGIADEQLVGSTGELERLPDFSGSERGAALERTVETID